MTGDDQKTGGAGFDFDQPALDPLEHGGEDQPSGDASDTGSKAGYWRLVVPLTVVLVVAALALTPMGSPVRSAFEWVRETVVGLFHRDNSGTSGISPQSGSTAAASDDHVLRGPLVELFNSRHPLAEDGAVSSPASTGASSANATGPWSRDKSWDGYKMDVSFDEATGRLSYGGVSVVMGGGYRSVLSDGCALPSGGSTVCAAAVWRNTVVSATRSLNGSDLYVAAENVRPVTVPPVRGTVDAFSFDVETNGGTVNAVVVVFADGSCVNVSGPSQVDIDAAVAAMR